MSKQHSSSCFPPWSIMYYKKHVTLHAWCFLLFQVLSSATSNYGVLITSIDELDYWFWDCSEEWLFYFVKNLIGHCPNKNKELLIYACNIITFNLPPEINVQEVTSRNSVVVCNNDLMTLVLSSMSVSKYNGDQKNSLTRHCRCVLVLSIIPVTVQRVHRKNNHDYSQ